MVSPVPWHRLFGIALTDIFTGRPWRVELEKEVAIRSQRLDVLIIERCATNGDVPARAAGAGTDAGPDPNAETDAVPDAALEGLPDGLDHLAPHNVLTYKSAHQPLDGWAMDELVSHYVSYRKLASGDTGPSAPPATAPDATTATRALLPEQAFRLFAVATRYPAKLLGQLPATDCQPTAWPGVFDLRWGHRAVRLIVLGDIARHPRNAPWELFSARTDRIGHGFRHYQPRAQATEDLLAQLYFYYRLEMPEMSYTLDDFKRDTRRLLIEHVHEFDPDELKALLERMDVQDRLRGLDPEQRLQGLDPEQRLRGLDPALVRAWLERNKP